MAGVRKEKWKLEERSSLSRREAAKGHLFAASEVVRRGRNLEATCENSQCVSSGGVALLKEGAVLLLCLTHLRAVLTHEPAAIANQSPP